MTTELADKMRSKADADSLPPDHALRSLADEFDKIAEGYPNVDARKLLGAWARARRAWCQYTGEKIMGEV
jgi:hypothetical protein